MKALKQAINKNGIQYALIQNGNTFAVYKLCENYCRHMKSGINKAWRYVEKDMTFNNAEILFNLRTK
jgi:hypothetical protein